MNSYEETLVETLRHVIELYNMQAPLGEAIDGAEKLLEAGPEGYAASL